uniref:Acyl-coenzyme A diphosphatase NUDT19 n=1 Tax=Latimeria chalumnae TaxID=7897 RepID=H3AYR1_LATCH|nr:PREDICTED: nucleoside diphosphate-linked moiety X motif 19, mitochondrial [Latimeria chalumnae]|eukprot:XP_005997967.1 PREDICTED: nucleoside diphosphate-linked moiety X motif 19, mitochondrial [Latimeria chalumnae]
MNQALKHWKEAATVILTAGVRGRVAGAGLWPDSSGFDYEVLLLQRSGSSGFMPNAYVFPGGLLDPCDFSGEWLPLLRQRRPEGPFGLAPVRQGRGSRAPLFATDRAQLGSPLPGEVAFRICAIRETFEEAGILLATPQGERLVQGEGDADVGGQGLGEQVSREELACWRSRVQDDPRNFIQMCQELSCLPNIWALWEWGNWLTPTRSGHGRRYDTAFFICCLSDAPHTITDDKEIVRFEWSSPAEVLRRYEEGEMWVASPQFYELSRLCRFTSHEELRRFGQDRAPEGSERWLSVRMKVADGLVDLLPGDELYPEEPDYTGERLSDAQLASEKTAGELRQGCARLHRIEMDSLYAATIHVNIEPRCKHVHPLAKTACLAHQQCDKLVY